MTTKLMKKPKTVQKKAIPTHDELIAECQQEEYNQEREEILNDMTPACRKKLRDIEQLLYREVKQAIRNRYDLGLQVRELYEDEKNNGGKLYGRDAIGRICEILRWDDGVIRLSLRLVQMYTPDEIEKICSLVLPRNRPLTWSHLRALLPVDDAVKRQELLDRTVTEGWTCQALAQEVMRLKRGETEEKRGRPPRIPRNFDDVIAQQRQSAEQWERLQDKIWNFPAHSLATHAEKLQPDEVTEERLRQARELAGHLRHVARQADEQAMKAEQVVQDFERILSERQQDATSAQPVTTARSMTE